MQTLNVVVWGLVALGLLVFVHELGHFLLAKAAGIRVLAFSLGFGPKFAAVRWGETELRLSWLPLGGYVKMAGELPEAGRVPAPGEYLSRPWWVRVGVLCGGPAANFIASALVLGTLFWVGYTVPLAKPQVQQVEPGLPAAAAGLEVGDVITTLNGRAVEDWEAFSEALNRAAAAPGAPALTLGLLRQGRDLTANVRPVRDETKGRWRIGVSIGPAGTTRIERVYVGTPAEIAGLKAGDRVLSVEGGTVWTRWDFQNVIWKRAGQPTRLSVLREGRTLELLVTPIVQQLPGQGRVGVVGVSFKSSDAVRRVQHGFFKAYRLGAVQTWGLAKAIFVSLAQMFTGQVSVQDSVGGPITIMRMAGQEAHSGVEDFLFFLASISVMLAVLNLLPIPVLDGGNAVLFILEGLRGRPLSLRWQDGLQRVGLALLLALMVYATYNDLYKLILPAFGSPTP